MDEKRYIFETVEITDCDTDVSRIAKVITDKEECYSYENLCDIPVLLNEQQATISALQIENNHLTDVIKEYAKRYEEQQATISHLEEECKEKLDTFDKAEIEAINIIYEEKGFDGVIEYSRQKLYDYGVVKEKNGLVGITFNGDYEETLKQIYNFKTYWEK